MGRTQKHRQVRVSTSLGDDDLLFSQMTGTEALSQLFRYDLELLSENFEIDFNQVVGSDMTVCLELADGNTRHFHGYVSRFEQTTPRANLAVYGATLVPWFWFLTRTTDCRIFQKKTVPDIIKQVFRDHGFTDFDERLSDSYRTWEYCVQYRETDFNFVSRLMEQEGIYYFFEHENGKHTLVMADAIGAHSPFPGYDKISYRPSSTGSSRVEYIRDWSIGAQVQPGSYTLNDFDFEKPKKRLECRSIANREHAMADLPVYDYPGEYIENGDGDRYAGVRRDELQAQYEIAEAQSDARGICTGYKFQLEEYPRGDQNKQYLIVSAKYDLKSDAYDSFGSDSGSSTYQATFRAMDANQQFRPARITPRPVIQGPQTAIIAGKKGEEIYVDEHGRVKVKFHWDRYSKADEKSSCWIRVSQGWAGKKWGSIFIPRIGHEVIVEFLEGDPDQPIITGRVYNGDNKTPYDLPGEATKSTIKTLSSKGGGGFNELRFEDKKGKEQIFLHAEKDQDIRVKNDAREWIGNDRHLIVKENQISQVDGDKHDAVKGDYNEKVDGIISVQAGMDMQEKVGMNHAMDAGMNIHLKAGMNVVIEAGMSITLKAGGGFIVVGPAGVTISGTPVLINSGGAAGSGAGSSPQSPQSPDEADDDQAGKKTSASGRRRKTKKSKLKNKKAAKYSPAAAVLKQASKDGTPFCEKCARARARMRS